MTGDAAGAVLAGQIARALIDTHGGTEGARTAVLRAARASRAPGLAAVAARRAIVAAIMARDLTAYGCTEAAVTDAIGDIARITGVTP